MAIAITPELIIGIIGSIILVIAWVWETYENYEKHSVSVHLHFSILYITGNLLLTWYSWTIHSMIFFVLSIILICAIFGETIYAVSQKKHTWIRHKRR